MCVCVYNANKVFYIKLDLLRIIGIYKKELKINIRIYNIKIISLSCSIILCLAQLCAICDEDCNIY